MKTLLFFLWKFYQGVRYLFIMFVIVPLLMAVSIVGGLVAFPFMVLFVGINKIKDTIDEAHGIYRK